MSYANADSTLRNGDRRQDLLGIVWKEAVKMAH